MYRQPPRSTRTDTLSPDPTLVRAARSDPAPDHAGGRPARAAALPIPAERHGDSRPARHGHDPSVAARSAAARIRRPHPWALRSEEHTSELQSLMRISYAVFCLKQKKKINFYLISS